MELLTFGLIISILILAGYYLYKAAYNGYDIFEKKGVLTLPVSPFVGSFGPIYRRKVTLSEFVQNVYNAAKDAKIIGLYDRKFPIYFIRDPELIKQIAIKDFDYFVGRYY